MNRDELSYRYAYDEYQQQLARKRDIRDRSAFFFGLNLPILSSIGSLSISSADDISCPKLILLVLSGLLLIKSLALFLMIYIPSNQKMHSVKSITQEALNLYNKPECQTDLNSTENADKQSKMDDLAHRFYTNTYIDNYEFYEAKHKIFKRLFIMLAIAMSLCYVLLSVSLGV